MKRMGGTVAQLTGEALHDKVVSDLLNENQKLKERIGELEPRVAKLEAENPLFTFQLVTSNSGIAHIFFERSLISEQGSRGGNAGMIGPAYFDLDEDGRIGPMTLHEMMYTALHINCKAVTRLRDFEICEGGYAPDRWERDTFPRPKIQGM
jgi:hypothetical protein